MNIFMVSVVKGTNVQIQELQDHLKQAVREIYRKIK